MSPTSLAWLLMLVALPASAQVPSSQVVLASTGLGTNGVASRTHWFMSGQVHVYLWTGRDPENYGTFTLDLPFALLGEVAGGGSIARPICVMSASRTGNDYAGAYANPEWPPVFLWEEAYDLPHQTEIVGWSVWGQSLQPASVYSVNVVCPPKIAGFNGSP